MKKTLTVISAGLILSFSGYAQNTIAESEHNAKRIKKEEEPNAIFFAPLNLFDFENPNFQVGYERFVAKRWTLQIEVGIIIPHSIINSLIDIANGIKISECPYTNKGFRISGSVKYVFLVKNKIKVYVSSELFYLRNKSGINRSFSVSDPEFEYSFGITPDDAEYGYDQFFYNDEEKMGINIKVGAKLPFEKRFFSEPYLGIGLAYRNVVQTGRENPNDKLLYSLGIFDKAAPNRWVPTIPLNFKFGYKF